MEKKLLQYSALASAFVVSNADAQVVYTDLDADIVLNEPDMLAWLDINNDGYIDFRFANARSFSTTFYRFSQIEKIWLLNSNNFPFN